jgi:hypothetical protein
MNCDAAHPEQILSGAKCVELIGNVFRGTDVCEDRGAFPIFIGNDVKV